MAESAKSLPYVAFPGLMSLVDRMGDEGIPGKIDKEFLVGMAPGTQYQYRQTFRGLGLTTSGNQPTPLLTDLVHANDTDRRELFGKIITTQYPDLVGLPLDASKEDFSAVLRDRYGVNSDVQRRKMLTFFVAVATYAGLQISPYIRPTKARTGPRKPRAEAQADHGAGTMTAKRQDISLGDAGSVSVIVNVDRWWEMSEDQFAKLRKLIKEIEALGDSGI